MKNLFWILLSPCIAQAAPFLVSGPESSGLADTCAYQEGAVVTRTPLVAGACHADWAAIVSIPGTHTVTVWFESSLNGAKSVATPFSFTPYQAGGAGPGSVGISKQ